MEKEGVRRDELAKSMGVSSQQINKIIRAKSNLTFETLDRIEEAMGVTITTPKITKKDVFK